MSKTITEGGHVFPIPCVGRDKRAAIFYVHSQGGVAGMVEFHVRTFAAVPTLEQDDGHIFLLRLKPERIGVWKIDHIDNQGFPEFVASGIPEALLPAIAEEFGVKIWSQSAWRQNNRAETGLTLRGQRFRIEAGGQFERNTCATKMWERLKGQLDKFQVMHDADEDVYQLVRRQR